MTNRTGRIGWAVAARRRTALAIGAALAGFSIVGCAASGPSPELVDARASYDRARTGPAAQLAPEQLLTAHRALTLAEDANAHRPGSFQERSFAYIAKRRAQLAAAQASTVEAEHEIAGIEQGREENEAQLRRRMSQQLGERNQQLRQTQQQLAIQNRELVNERTARQEAEQRASAAMQSLQEVARVKEEARGVVITLSGEVLFASGRSELLPIAQSSLSRVADALKEQDPSKKILIEGYTDSRGSDALNMRLSQARADSVRGFLISRGLDASRIEAVGKGESNPVASNDSPEGRANNRRVEIVVLGSSGNNPPPAH